MNSSSSMTCRAVLFTVLLQNYTIGAYFHNLEVCRLLRCSSHGVTRVHIKERNIQGISVLAFINAHIIFYTIHRYIPTWQFCLLLEENTLTCRIPLAIDCQCRTALHDDVRGVRCVARVVNKSYKRINLH